MKPEQTASLRDHVLSLPRGGGAHLKFDAAVADLPAALRFCGNRRRVWEIGRNCGKPRGLG